MSFSIYIISALVLVSGLMGGAYLMNIPQQWIAIGAIVLLGLSVLTGVSNAPYKKSRAI